MSFVHDDATLGRAVGVWMAGMKIASLADLGTLLCGSRRGSVTFSIAQLNVA